jgi:hypothetical protein
MPWLHVTTRAEGLRLSGLGVLVMGAGLLLPTRERRVTRVAHRLDEVMPRWQFREYHTLSIAAPPERVFDAIRRVKADEIFLFNLLTWIRRCGRPLPPGILNAGGRESLIDLATHTTFVRLADDPPRELVVGTVVGAPPGVQRVASAEMFRTPLPAGFALAAMDFVVRPDGQNGSIVSTETRVYANSDAARRRFAAYWRVIYPGSAIIRRMWLRAIKRRATMNTS